MNGRLSLGIVALATAALFVAPAAPIGQSVELQAQQGATGRYRVLVPRFFPLQEADDGFGEDAAESLRELLNGSPRHQPVPEDEIEDALDQFDLDWEDLDCIKARQLAQQINAQVTVCASYSEQNGQIALQDIAFIDMTTMEELDVEPVTVAADGGAEQAAQSIFGAFDRYVQLINFRTFCVDYAQSHQWENALRNCNSALELNPGATQTRYRKARILFDQAETLDASDPRKMQIYNQAYEELQTVLAASQFHEEALQLAGYIAIQVGQPEAGREYYSKYLEINPNADKIRLNIAYDMATAGDPLGAAALVEVGLQSDPDNPELLEYYGSYMFSAAQEEAERVQPTQDSDATLAPEVARLYREAIGALEKAYEIRGPEMAVGHLRNVIAAYMQLGELAKAISTAKGVLATHPEEASIWAVYADAQQRQGNLDEAIEALGRVAEIDPTYPNIAVRQGNWLLEAGRVEDALPYLHKAIEQGQDPEVVSRLIFADAHTNGVRTEDYDYAIRGLKLAKQFDVSAETRAELDFWHAFSVLQRAIEIGGPQSLETARRTKPMFEEALALFQASRSYAETQPSIDLGQMTKAAQTYIEIQDAIIKRGG